MSHFIQTLSELEKRLLLTKLDDNLTELVRECKNRGQKGELTVTLKIAPDNKNAELMHVYAEVKMKKPTQLPRSSIFYPTEEGQLSRTDPNQPEFNLAVTEGGAQPEVTEQPIAKAN